ncbi:MAG: ABC transporter ATP-binding protein [Deltaproteobacteria bacterium]
MSDIAISADKLSKLYLLGAGERYYTLRDALTDILSAPIRLFRRSKANSPASPDNQIWALRDVSFEIKRGEVVGIVGRNGAGKSTLLKILSRITEPTRGSAEVRGRVGSLLEVGTGFHPELTGRENIYLNGAILGMTHSEIKRKFDEIVAFAEIEKFIDTTVKFYSTGMYMRLAFAVAAYMEPEILLIDEVLAVGDAAFQKKCLNKMQDVGGEGRTVLFVSHNMPAITRLCSRAILLGQGGVVADGASHEVISGYLQSGVGTTAQRCWQDFNKAPGNSIARLVSVRVLDGDGNVSDTVDIRKPVRIEIEYHNFPNDYFPYAGIQLFDENDVCLFSSGDFTDMNWRYAPRRFDGRVKSVCAIPGNFLAEGLKRVLVAITTYNPDAVLAMERDAVSFMVVDRSEGDGARGDYSGYFPGVVRPLLDWRVDTETLAKS